VLGRRDDDYHDLRSLVIGIDLADQVRCRASLEPGIALDCNDPALNNGDNIAVRAPGACPAVRLRTGPAHRTAKRIPVSGGLGGGSGDAATTLRLRLSWETGSTKPNLPPSARNSADVPLCFRCQRVIEDAANRYRQSGCDDPIGYYSSAPYFGFDRGCLPGTDRRLTGPISTDAPFTPPPRRVSGCCAITSNQPSSASARCLFVAGP
jgi:hypothetical protein